MNIMISAKTEKEAPCTKDPKEIEAKPSENMESAPKTILEDKKHKDPKEIEVKPAENMESAPKTIVEDKKHMEQMLAVSTIPLRLDHQIQCIKTIQQELLKLHLKQVMLLDGCTELLHELNAVQPTNENEEIKVLETFREVKSKLSGVFEHYLPAQLSILKQESKISQMPADVIPK
ncbi:uncharacterized protein LOC116801767 isoform X2 [Drosophila sechellia]|uniref:uncharacterized protein LOC116801767 isoform X2 n=1 Tax=Drosophila sechellia TaxID=7238 RepID=UPI0013DE75D0|nr:uncharacterized protein LOC116801767 isoform X2 [Drosophila sechellia]